MADYIPHEVGRIRRDKALEQYLSDDYVLHVPMIWLADCNRVSPLALLVLYFGRINDALIGLGAKPKQGAGSKHQLGYYKQGVN